MRDHGASEFPDHRLHNPSTQFGICNTYLRGYIIGINNTN